MITYFSLEKIGPFYTWGIFLALGLLTPFIFILKQAKKEGVDENKIWDIFLWIVAGSIIGMRLGYVLQFFKEYFLNPWEILKFWDGGLTFYGGLIGGIGGAVLYAKQAKLGKNEFLQIADLVALYFPLGIIVGRIGCFLINDHQGSLTTLPWGIIWPDGTIRHPVALYLILSGLILFLLLQKLRPRLKKLGQLSLAFLFLYSFFRFFIDFTRSAGEKFSDPHYLSLTVSQWVSLAIIFVSALIMIVSRLKVSRSRS